MAYIDSSGNVVEKKTSFFEWIFSFFNFFILFFRSLLCLDNRGGDANANRDHLRRANGAGGGWPGSGGPGGPGRRNDGGGAGRRQIGRLPQSSGMSCPPMAGGG